MRVPHDERRRFRATSAASDWRRAYILVNFLPLIERSRCARGCVFCTFARILGECVSREILERFKAIVYDLDLWRPRRRCSQGKWHIIGNSPARSSLRKPYQHADMHHYYAKSTSIQPRVRPYFPALSLPCTYSTSRRPLQPSRTKSPIREVVNQQAFSVKSWHRRGAVVSPAIPYTFCGSKPLPFVKPRAFRQAAHVHTRFSVLR